jgi:hypothetical protein
MVLRILGFSGLAAPMVGNHGKGQNGNDGNENEGDFACADTLFRPSPEKGAVVCTVAVVSGPANEGSLDYRGLVPVTSLGDGLDWPRGTC